ncbi:MAG: sulfatase-like hydrolase/transferase [Bacilli bacterium]|nr:sulfatase-like hydrolase/transferase [Bacilli bacterium]
MKEKINNLISNLSSILKDLFIKYYGFIFIFIFILIIDWYTYNLVSSVSISNSGKLSSFLFTLSYVELFIAFLLLFSKKLRKVILLTASLLITIMFVVNTIYFSMFGTFFSFNNLVLAGEGSGYFLTVINALDFKLITIFASLLVMIVLSFKYMPKQRYKSDMTFAIILLILGLFSRGSALVSLGDSVDPLAWNAWSHKKNIYDSYTDTKKSMKLSGFYEYVLRDLYLTSTTKNIDVKESVTYLNNYFTPNEITTDSSYEGVFKDKNVIVVMMETIDSWLVTEENMPTVYKLMNSGINFTNHFSVIYGGGATFNSEFMINTGYMTPFNSQLAAYSFTENDYAQSLANLFKNAGYSANNIHFNYGTYYNRADMTESFGYDDYISALEMGYGNESKLDSFVMTDETLRNLFLPDGKFMTYYTTYSGHMPYNYDEYLCSTIATKFGVSEEEIMADENLNCITVQAKETDNFFELLLENLEEKGILDDTVIIGITDHYAYTFNDQEYVYDIKGVTDENMIHNVPFFIWSSDIESMEIDEVNSNLDVLPTIASLFGLDYNPTYYLGSNILSDTYSPFVFFSDYSWYDGNVYYKDGSVVFGNASQELIEANSAKVNSILDINTKVLETNYFANK